MPVVYHCPHCQQPVTVPDQMLGQAIGCPHCRKPFQTFPPAPVPAAPAPPAPRPAPPPPPPPAKVFSLDDDDEEPRSGEGAFENLDESPRRRRKRRRRDEDEDDEDDSGRYARSRGRYKPGQQKMPLSQLFGTIGGIIGGVGVAAFNVSNRRPNQGFNPTEILIAAVVGGACAGLGWLLGKMLEGPSAAQRRRRRRDDDDD